MIDGVEHDGCEDCGRLFTADDVANFRAWCARTGVRPFDLAICKVCAVKRAEVKMRAVGRSTFWADAIAKFELAKRAN